MSTDRDSVPDPTKGVARTAVATSAWQPGGYVLTEEHIPELIMQGTPLEEIIPLELAPRERVEEIARQLVAEGRVPADRFKFLR